MERIEYFIEALDNVLNTRQRRHIAGGVLLSLSLLFGGLACTAMTIKTE